MIKGESLTSYLMILCQDKEELASICVSTLDGDMVRIALKGPPRIGSPSSKGSLLRRSCLTGIGSRMTSFRKCYKARIFI